MSDPESNNTTTDQSNHFTGEPSSLDLEDGKSVMASNHWIAQLQQKLNPV